MQRTHSYLSLSEALLFKNKEKGGKKSVERLKISISLKEKHKYYPISFFTETFHLYVLI